MRLAAPRTLAVMERRRRRTDHLPHPGLLPAEPLGRARAACDLAAAAGFDASLAIHVPDNGSQGVLCGASGRVEPSIDVARGVARSAAHEGRALQLIDADGPVRGIGLRHAAVPVGRTEDGTIVLVVSDSRLTRREGQALATWAAPDAVSGMRVRGGACAGITRRLARDHGADVVVLALFAASGIRLDVHVRSGAMLHTCRVPSDTVWGEVARHGAAFTLGDLAMHPGTALLGSLGMRTAALVGLENGHGIAIGALGIASVGDLDIDIAHHLLADAPALGPEVMARLSTTSVPVPAPDGTVDLRLLAARVGCRRFAMYERVGTELHLVAAHGPDGTPLGAHPDELETQLVGWAAQKGVGVVSDDAAAVLIGNHTVLYAQDPGKRALDCLRLALQDVRRNPFGGEDLADDERAA
ncbi:MAG: hypothetical protein JWL76_645 [Thermoleophilia bacterium]|nr:hypothetical protein [Thermoleophilia bacterium]